MLIRAEVADAGESCNTVHSCAVRKRSNEGIQNGVTEPWHVSGGYNVCARNFLLLICSSTALKASGMLKLKDNA